MGYIQELKMLLTLKAWLRSWQLKGGGIVILLAAAQTWITTPDGMDLLTAAAMLVHLMPATLTGVLGGVIGLALLLLRAKTEWSLSEKVSGVDKQQEKP
jgi:hypothetical protein